MNIYPSKIILKNYKNKRGCAFLEFSSTEMANYVLTEYNNKNINGVQLKFNWVHSLQDKYNSSKVNKFTLFVGNIDKSIPFDEVKNFFCSKYSSIISSKLLINPQTGRSKGYAFFEFLNYKEFNDALNIKEPLIFGKQRLVLNSAKNKYNYEEDEKINEIEKKTSYENRQSFDSLNSFNQNHSLSNAETEVSSIRNSKDSINFNIKSDKSDKSDKNIEFQLEIEDCLKKLSKKYPIYNNKASIFNYYCSPFIYNSQNKKELSDNLNKNGGYIPGIRPGDDTVKYIKMILNRITIVGAVFLAVLAGLPILFSKFSTLKTSISISGTGLLIVVGVALETYKQLESQLVSRTYTKGRKGRRR